MNTPTTGRTYTNMALTVIAGLLAINTFDRARTGFVGEAQAQPTTVRNAPGASAATPGFSEDESSGRINPAEQRKQIVTELRSIGTRLDRVEAVLRTGLSVKVTELPPGFGTDKSNKGDRAEKAEKVAPVTTEKK